MLNWKTTLSIALVFSFVAAGCSTSESAESSAESMAEAADESTESEQKEAEKVAEKEEKSAEKKADKAGAETDKKMTEATASVKGGPEGVEVGGYCPVAYKMAGKPIQGKKEFAVEHKGKSYYLANEKAKKAFNKEPAKYAIKYDGWCATGLSKGTKVQGDPSVFMVHEGETYLFSSKKAKKMFEKNPAEMIEKADKNWKKIQMK